MLIPEYSLNETLFEHCVSAIKRDPELSFCIEGETILFHLCGKEYSVTCRTRGGHPSSHIGDSDPRKGEAKIGSHVIGLTIVDIPLLRKVGPILIASGADCSDSDLMVVESSRIYRTRIGTVSEWLEQLRSDGAVVTINESRVNDQSETFYNGTLGRERGRNFRFHTGPAYDPIEGTPCQYVVLEGTISLPKKYSHLPGEFAVPLETLGAVMLVDDGALVAKGGKA